jgi:hypothetical protein
MIGIGAFVVSLLCYSAATTLIVQVVSPFIRAGRAGVKFWQDVAIMMFVSLMMAAVHLVLIGIWAVVLLQLEERMASFEIAFYCSAQNYTALGYGDIVLSERWRLLGPLEAINGLLLFGVSTATMFAVMSRLIRNRLRI